MLETFRGDGRKCVDIYVHKMILYKGRSEREDKKFHSFHSSTRNWHAEDGDASSFLRSLDTLSV
jgi:hypothetical protein